ncbi:hypothetical protein C7T94_10855 [Pedobacter yulinensis]|uniref:Redox-active disulfide protein 2 n=1 Tax=Pedobacter yulinensis TaxID=2126353 RepID=A0A2T3HKX2_9SPHI|nr:hypothetical protein [Pedobacter yulinensis]PST83105.1 hypothetical protein C7T94_10855 [Pedobacter yulinensis]
MKTNAAAGLTDEKLIKQRNLLKGAIIGLGVFYLVALGILGYLAATRGVKNMAVALIPVFSLPITLLPLLISLNTLNKEIKSRNLSS